MTVSHCFELRWTARREAVAKSKASECDADRNGMTQQDFHICSMLELAELVLTHGVSLRATADLVKILDHEVSALT